MTSSKEWRIEVSLGQELAVFGRIRGHGGHGEIVGYGRKPRNYEQDYNWLTQIRESVVGSGGSVTLDEIRLWERCPDREAGLLKENEAGFYGGSEVMFLDVLLATWSAAGGIAGITAFLKMLKEIRSFWSSKVSIQITLPDGAKIQVSKEGDINDAFELIDQFEATAADRTSEGIILPATNELQTEQN